MNLMTIGEKSERVKTLQSNLNRLENSLPPLDADGIFGNLTADKVKAFQKKHGLRIDGIVGQETQNKINSLLSPTQTLTTTTAQPSFTEVLKNKIESNPQPSKFSISYGIVGLGIILAIYSIYKKRKKR